MLNELYELSNTLSGLEIGAREWHREYKPIPKVSKNAPCFRIWLASNGEIANIETVDGELAVVLRKYGDNQSTFPAFNIVPLYRVTNREQQSRLDQMCNGKLSLDIDEIKSWCTQDNWCAEETAEELPDTNRKTYSCVVTRSKKLLELIHAQDLQTRNSVTELISIAGKYFADTADGFRSALEKCLFQYLSDSENIRLCFQLLFHIGNNEKAHKKDRGPSLSIILDLADWQSYKYPVANEHTTDWINEILLKSDASDDSDARVKGGFDAFGEPYANVGEPMPGVKLKGFEVTLRAMFNAQHCQYRYNKIDDESYPITKENRALAKQSLEWIARTENEGITWRAVDNNEIIFVYPSVLPKIPLKLVSLFNEKPGNAEQTESRFDHIAKGIIKTLQGLPPNEIPENIQVFSIRKMDKARSKVVFNRNYSSEWFIQAAEEWQRGCWNLPTMDIRAFSFNRLSDNGKPLPEQIELRIPFPLQVPKIVNAVWKQNGETKVSTKRMQYFQGMELLLDPVRKSSDRYYLDVLLLHAIGLILHIGNQQHKGLAGSTKQGKEIGNVLAALGLLLYKCGCTKEDYMENTAYLIGQLLKISDELHAFYCKIVRKDDVPPQLAGNSVFVVATETPIAAIAQLGTRMAPYLSWAKQYRTKNNPDSGLAGWYLRLYEDTATKLQSLLTDRSVRFNDLDKAQIFIGYLAAFPKNEKISTVEEEEKNNE
jgi:hypothetical protein